MIYRKYNICEVGKKGLTNRRGHGRGRGSGGWCGADIKPKQLLVNLFLVKIMLMLNRRKCNVSLTIVMEILLKRTFNFGIKICLKLFNLFIACNSCVMLSYRCAGMILDWADILKISRVCGCN